MASSLLALSFSITIIKTIKTINFKKTNLEVPKNKKEEETDINRREALKKFGRLAMGMAGLSAGLKTEKASAQESRLQGMERDLDKFVTDEGIKGEEVSEKTYKMLKNTALEAVEGYLEAEKERLNSGFWKYLEDNHHRFENKSTAEVKKEMLQLMNRFVNLYEKRLSFSLGTKPEEKILRLTDEILMPSMEKYLKDNKKEFKGFSRSPAIEAFTSLMKDLRK